MENTSVKVKKKSTSKKRDTICWTCEHALDLYCTWMDKCKPVKNWTAIYNPDNDGYCVVKCPKYIKQDREKRRLEAERRLNELSSRLKEKDVKKIDLKRWRPKEYITFKYNREKGKEQIEAAEERNYIKKLFE